MLENKKDDQMEKLDRCIDLLTQLTVGMYGSATVGQAIYTFLLNRELPIGPIKIGLPDGTKLTLTMESKDES